MRKVASVAVVSLLWLALGTSRAAAEDVKRACVAASTSGQTLRRDEKLLEAREQMLSCAREVCPSVVRSKCARWATEIDEQIPSIVVRAQKSSGGDVVDARVVIDGKPARLDGKPVALDPGEHTVVVVVDGGPAPKEERVLLADGEKSRLLVIQISAGASGASPATPEAPVDHGGGGIPTGAWILGGVGVVALGGFAYFGLTAKSDLDALRASCAPSCTDEQTSGGRTKAVVADVSLGVGIAALGGAVVWAILGSGKGGASTAGVRVDVVPVAGGAELGIVGRY